MRYFDSLDVWIKERRFRKLTILAESARMLLNETTSVYYLYISLINIAVTSIKTHFV